MKSLVIGIAGGTASGKSTVASQVVQSLGERCVHLMHDRYYRGVPRERNPAEHNFDHPDALETDRLVRDLDELRRGRSVRVPRYDFSTSSRLPEEDTLTPRPVVIVEGILVLTDAELRSRFDHRVFVFTPDDVRLSRRIRRDIAERGRTWDEVLEQYEQTVRPMHEAFVAPSSAHADLVLDGTGPVDELVARVLALVR